MKGAKGLILLVLGIFLIPLGMMIGWHVEYSGPWGIPTFPYMIPGLIMFILGCFLIPLGIYYFIRGREE